jgi:hypothetical protein
MKNNYTFFEQILHQLTINNAFFNELSFFMEQSLFLKKAEAIEPKMIFVSGLARSGTTSILNHLVNSQVGNSLTYKDLPFLFMPNLRNQWAGNNMTPSPLKERAHGDNILINEESPEAIDEIFWKFQLSGKYIQKNFLHLHDLSERDLLAFKRFVQLHLYKHKSITYVTKNNNSILRYHSLKTSPKLQAFFIFALREPLSHAISLLKQHQLFGQLHQEDAFSLTYFNSMGHYEFGANQKPFNLQNEVLNQQLERTEKCSLQYWLLSWMNYYQYLLDNFAEEDVLVDFDDLCEFPNEIIQKFVEKWKLDQSVLNIQSYSKPKHLEYVDGVSDELLKECQSLYMKLKGLCISVN